jgi:hypothetical protein
MPHGLEIKMKNLTTNFLLLLVSVVLSLLILEQSYRVYLFGVASFSIEKMNSLHPLGDSGLIKPSNNPEIVFELKPDLNSYFKLAKLKTNSKGLRDKEYKLSKPGDVFRIAVIGDSFTMPAGVEIDKAYHSLLEEKLNKEQRGATYEFINFGVGGYDLRQYLGVIKFKAQGYDPDLIIVGFCPVNDHKVSDNVIFQQQYKARPATSYFFHSHVWESLEKYVLEPLEKKIFGKKNKHHPRYVVTSAKSEARYMNHIFSEMGAISKKANTPIVIVYLNNKYDETFAKKIENLVVNNGLYYLNVSIPFEGEDGNTYSIYLTDRHPNEKANSIFAEQIYDYLNKEDLLEKTGTKSD